MPDTASPQGLSPPRVSILSQADVLIVSIHDALDDSHMLRLERDLLERVQDERARGIIIDVAALEVIDSFATHTLSRIERGARLKGATTVVVGISPEVAVAMVQLSLQGRLVHTALDLEEGLEVLWQLDAGQVHPSSVVARQGAPS